MNDTGRATGTGLRLAKLGVLSYASLLAAGLLAVLARSPQPTTPAIEASAACSSEDLAHYCRGARARVSSFHTFGSHHPLFAIDGRDSADLVEKWTSADSDRAPWIEVAFPSPVSFSRVGLTLAGSVEDAGYTMRSYRLSCFEGDELRGALGVPNNADPKPVHALACSEVDRLRIDFDVEPGTAQSLVRLYEIEVRP